MKYSAHKAFVSFGQLIALSILTCAIPAFAQFEVSPDHFDSGPAVAKTKRQAAKTSVKTTNAGSAKAGGKGGNQPAPQAVAGSNSQAGSTGAGQSQSNGRALAATNAAAAKPKKRAPANKVVLASTQ